MSRTIEVAANRRALMEACASAFVASARAAIGARGRFVTALSGGSTPRALFELLATDRFASSVDWSRVGVNAGRMAANILKGKKPADLPVSLPSRADHEMKISARRMSDLGLTLPDALKSCNCVIQ